MTSLELPTSLDAALGRSGEPRAGGTDLTERRKLHLSKGTVVDLRDVPGLDAITWREGQLHLGALVTLAAVAEHPDVRARYPAVAATAATIATPQIRARATVGGNLLQHVRCWYYRRPGADCLKSGGSGCPARTGDHLFHACFDLGPCVAPHPSSLATALLAHDVRVEVAGDREHTLASLYGDASDARRQHMLPPGALLTGVGLGPPLAAEQAAYVRATSRARAEWPLVEVVARLVVAGDQLQTARITVGGVANLPLRLGAVEALLVGKPARPETLAAAAAVATDGAKPLAGTAYKLDLLRGAVLDALERALAQPPTQAAPPAATPAPT
ncbi:FAD binding domain-containing protein [Nannocystis sp. ILAH1]|uniref:FAD binding domain-containing protein n=1 Tax=unclassified Nannocystis TaxID=2627009 RepID=UPI00226DFDC9|nr:MULTISPECIES: FAD binding domain-containing protein [unclassified Nannocystis]MCY0994057.1 FAD binding domain-containing protein [Nannocystis sp. ILAH1]MCY1067026.1 FAD binding domain-containing protein [Nannocystis sp. RBIL2]